VRATLDTLGLGQAGYTLCLMGCDDARMAKLNGTFRSKPKPTNVLSWPSEDRGVDSPGGVPFAPDAGPADDPTELGDIALGYEICLAEARDQLKTAQDHVTHLIVHGLLHLLGYDHIHAEDARLMESSEVQILASLGISDPYIAKVGQPLAAS
jgi:probable rRNA maturation factor